MEIETDIGKLQLALEQAVKFHHASQTSDNVVATASKFYAFLKNELVAEKEKAS